MGFNVVSSIGSVNNSRVSIMRQQNAGQRRLLGRQYKRIGRHGIAISVILFLFTVVRRVFVVRFIR